MSRAKYKDNPGYFLRKAREERAEEEFSRILRLKSKRLQLRELCRAFPRNYPVILKSKRFRELYDFVLKATPLLDDNFYKLSTRVFWILNGLKEFPHCKNRKCRKLLVKRNVKEVFGEHPKYCSSRCATSDSQYIKKREITIHKKYGSRKEILKRSHATYREKTGFDNPMKNPKVVEKGRSTYKKRTGFEHNFKNPEVKAKRKRTWRKKYGVDNPNRCQEIRDKIDLTNLNRLGVRSPFQSDSYNKHSRKVFDFDGYTFASLPELCYYIWLKDNDIKFEFQPKTDMHFEFDGVVHKYTPDFMIMQSRRKKFVDIKGVHFFKDRDQSKEMVNPYDHSKDELYEAKHQCMLRNKVAIICDYQKYVDFVLEKYGLEFLEKH